MSYYARNHLQADWDAEASADEAERLERAEREAGSYFAKATVVQKTIFDLAMSDLRGLHGPRYDRAREAAHCEWAKSTATARHLYDRSVAELMATGEISEAMSLAWDDLIANPVATMEAA